MNTIINFISILIFICLLANPILIIYWFQKNNLKLNFFVYILFGLTISGFLIVLLAWWFDKSNMMLLEQYGYNYHALTDIDRYINVQKIHLEKVKLLERSIMGIGWPLKAFFGILGFSVYLLSAYFVQLVLKNTKGTS